MRIECPACAAAYEVPAGMLAAGQAVACARCGNNWTPLTAQPPAADLAIPAAPPRPASPVPPERQFTSRQFTAPGPPPLSTADADRPAPPSAEPSRPDWFPHADAGWSPSDERSPLVPLAWIGSVATLLALLGAGVIARDSLMAQWPPASRLFSAIGLDDR